MGTSWVALSNTNMNNSSEQRNDVTKKKISKFSILMGGGVLPSAGMWQGEVFAISDCLVYMCGLVHVGHAYFVLRRLFTLVVITKSYVMCNIKMQ